MDIDTLLNHEDATISCTASHITELKLAYENNEITYEQYTELVHDALELQQVINTCESVDKKNILIKTIDFLKSFSGVFK